MRKFLKILTALLLLSISADALAQGRLYTRKAKLEDFPTRTTKVVTSSGSLLDLAFKEEVATRWRISPFEFCTPEELARYSTMKWAEGVEMGPETVNLKLFRVAAENYISSLDGTNTDLMLLVRQLEPTSEGLPLQFYFFTKAKDWISHEKTAADVIEHMVAVMPQFGLRIYQRPSGLDIRKNEVSA